MYQELSQLAEGKSGRLLTVISIFALLYYSVALDLLRGPESYSWLILDVLAILVFGLIAITTVWPRFGELLAQFEEAYSPYLSLATAVFFFAWALLLVMTGSDESIFLLISLGGGMVSVVEFLWVIFSADDSTQTL